MDIDIYKKYSFSFDTDKYVKNFKNSLDNAGIRTPANFNDLLKKAGIRHYNYETVKSYFYGRRVPPMDVFIAVCKSLKLNADAIAFPDSIEDPECDISIDVWGIEDFFRTVFYPYNMPEDGGIPDDLTEFFDAETYENDVNYIAKILSRYNYLIQKYHDIAVTNDELEQIVGFTSRYIIDRSKGGIIDVDEVFKWIRACDKEEFLDVFYDKYTLGFYTMNCHELLKVLSTAIDEKFIKYAEELLPYQDKTAR